MSELAWFQAGLQFEQFRKILGSIKMQNIGNFLEGLEIQIIL